MTLLGRASLAGALIAAAACARAPANAPRSSLPADALDAAIGAAIGDPTTCVLLADPASGKVVYRYGEAFNCARPLAACDRPGTLTAQTALALAAGPATRMASCASTPDGSRQVGWAEGRTTYARRVLLFSAVMEGQRALPGHEVNARLADALMKAGL